MKEHSVYTAFADFSVFRAEVADCRMPKDTQLGRPLLGTERSRRVLRSRQRIRITKKEWEHRIVEVLDGVCDFGKVPVETPICM
jgi:hypothetical protein